MAKKQSTALADQLLEAHLQHELAHMSGEALVEELRQDVDLVFSAAESIRLRAVVSPQTINAIIQRHVVERDIPAIVPEMAADFTTELVGTQFHKDVRPCDIISRDRVEELTDQLLLLREQRQELIDRLLEQPVYREMIANLLYQGIVRYVYEENLLSRSVPGISSALKFSSRMLNKAVSGLDEAWEKSIKGYISRNVESFTRQSAEFLQEHLTEDEMKASAMDAWDSFSRKSLGELHGGLGEIEWNEFVVIGYDFWLAFRRTDYFRHCYETVVESLFEQYGDSSLAELAREFNIDQQVVMTELEAVLPQASETLRANGTMEKILRRRLERFYHSDEARSLLNSE